MKTSLGRLAKSRRRARPADFQLSSRISPRESPTSPPQCPAFFGTPAAEAPHPCRDPASPAEPRESPVSEAGKTRGVAAAPVAESRQGPRRLRRTLARRQKRFQSPSPHPCRESARPAAAPPHPWPGAGNCCGVDAAPVPPGDFDGLVVERWMCRRVQVAGDGAVRPRSRSRSHAGAVTLFMSEGNAPRPSRARRAIGAGRAARRRIAPSTDRGRASSLLALRSKSKRTRAAGLVGVAWGVQTGAALPASAAAPGVAGAASGSGSSPRSFSASFSTSSKKRSCIFLSCGYSALTLKEISR